GERALHQFQIACLSGRPPISPRAWLRVVARRFATAMQRTGWARTVPLEEEPSAVDGEHRVRRHAHVERLCAELAPALTPPQREALAAACANRTTRGAAATCRMEPRDFRRYLTTIGQKARKRFALAD